MTLGHTQIPYLTRLWHPTTGCSQGCDYCWARPLVQRRLAGRMDGLPDPPPCGMLGHLGAFYPTIHTERLADPLRARKGQVIGVSFLGDLFDPAITDEQLLSVWGIMACSPQHAFIVLTKQAARMQQFLRWRHEEWWPKWQPEVYRQFGALKPLPNVWVGVSVDSQKTTHRINHLRRTPAAHRWVSAEPLLGPIDADLSGLDLVMVGGQSGPGAKPMHPDWARSLRDQCAAAGVRFCLKQWGEWGNYDQHDDILPDRCDADHGVTIWGDGRIYHGMNRETALDDGVTCIRIGTKQTGRLLDGVEHWDVPWMR